ncbi:McbB family protein [Priestia flexa]|uniref:McbB family protein n=1 Tax=Priestia flexa TaxID=86664 RepID=UPI001EF56A11|nr:McbB family protein [Priestia flexa]MCG7315589.1 McbB family protein [Priestia flexa]
MLHTESVSQHKSKVFMINKYLQYSLPDDSLVIQTTIGITKVTDKRMVNLLKEWDKGGVTKVSFDTLKNLFEEDTQGAIGYLESYGVIKSKKNINIDINGLLVVSNTHLTQQYVFDTLYNQYGINLDTKAVHTDDFLNLTDKELEQKLIVIILNPYDKTFVDSLLKKQKALNSSITLMGYIYANNFYMDCLYNYDWKLPCHNCHMGHIKSNLYLDESDHMTYQQIIDQLYSEANEGFEIGVPLSAVQELNIACLVVNKVNKYINDLSIPSIHIEEFNQCTLLDLKSFKKYEDTSIHWEMCDCYE